MLVFRDMDAQVMSQEPNAPHSQGEVDEDSSDRGTRRRISLEILLIKCSGPVSLNGRDVIFYFNRTGYFLQGLPWVTWE